MQLRFPLFYLLFLFLPFSAKAQMVGTDIFLKGKTVEIGQSSIGCYGSAGETPTGFHPRSGTGFNRIGFVADPAGDGWSVGTPNYMGDYFVPGSPHEGWDMMIGTTWNRAWGTSTGGEFTSSGGPLLLTGSTTSYSVVGKKKMAFWQGTMGNLAIYQKTTLDTTKTYFIIDVTLVNTSTTSSINNIYYERTVDPDNEVTITSDYETNNNIIYQPSLSNANKCLVVALGKDYPSMSYLGLGTVDCRAKSYILNPGNLTPSSNISNIYNGFTSYSSTEGDALTSDCGIGLIFQLGNLAPGDTTKFAYAYILKESDLDSAFSSLKPKWIIDGVTYFDKDTVRACVGSVLNASLTNAGSYTWGAWSPTVGLSSISGTLNNITVGTVTRTYKVVGTSPNCANDTMHITVQPYIHTLDTFEVSICNGASYYFNGASRTSTGFYKDTISSSKGCDSIINLHLTVKPPARDTIYAEICPMSSYSFGGSSINTEGMYEAPATIDGCPGTRTLFLTVTDTLKKTDTAYLCQGDSMVLDGNLITVPGLYSSYFATSGGCDSLHYFWINEKIVHHTHNSISLCQNDLPYNYYGLIIPAGTSTTMNFGEAVFTSSLSCDSFVMMDVYVIDTNRTNIDTTVCNGVVFPYGSNVVSSPGTYLKTLTNTLGCDSVVALQVSYLAPPYPLDSTYVGCDSLFYKGKKYYASTQLFDTFYNYLNCDSVYKQVNISIIPSGADTIFADICAGEKYVFNGFTFNQDTIFTLVFTGDNSCDSFSTLNLTVHDLPKVSLSYLENTSSLCVLDSVTLNATGAVEYDFYDIFNRLLAQENQSRILIPNTENTFVVIGTDEYGCKNSDSIIIHADACCDVLVPNAFSPNGDGINDVFKAVSLGHPQNYRIEIYNRWGQLVFVAYDINKAWDGTYSNQQKADAGTYFYQISGTCFDGTPLQLKGDLTLIR